MLLIAAGVAPFLAGRALATLSRRHRPFYLPCPLKLVTGIPCPTCGATRAFTLFAAGDPDWRSYNVVWPAYAVAATGGGVILSLLPEAQRHAVIAQGIRVAHVLERHPIRGELALGALALPGWIVALRKPKIRHSR